MGSVSNSSVLQETATDTRYNQLEQTLENFQVFCLRFFLPIESIVCTTNIFCFLGECTANGSDCK